MLKISKHVTLNSPFPVIMKENLAVFMSNIDTLPLTWPTANPGRAQGKEQRHGEVKRRRQRRGKSGALRQRTHWQSRSNPPWRRCFSCLQAPPVPSAGSRGNAASG